MYRRRTVARAQGIVSGGAEKLQRWSLPWCRSNCIIRIVRSGTAGVFPHVDCPVPGTSRFNGGRKAESSCGGSGLSAHVHAARFGVMKTFQPSYRYVIHPTRGIQVVAEESLEEFGPALLDIGDIQTPSEPLEVLAVVFDLEGFTHFTRQVDPQLAIPSFVSDFVTWLFGEIEECLVDQSQNNVLWAELPFFSKFTGDGVLFLWKIDMKKIVGIDTTLGSAKLQEHLNRFLCNIVASLFNFRRRYPLFLKNALRKYVDPPSRLRCGIARGNVVSLGGGNDFVGPCINIASRLQKFEGLSFAFSARGIDPEGFNVDFDTVFQQCRMGIRGIGEHELVYVVKEELSQLPAQQRERFKSA